MAESHPEIAFTELPEWAVGLGSDCLPFQQQGAKDQQDVFHKRVCRGLTSEIAVERYVGVTQIHKGGACLSFGASIWLASLGAYEQGPRCVIRPIRSPELVV